MEADLTTHPPFAMNPPPDSNSGCTKFLKVMQLLLTQVRKNKNLVLPQQQVLNIQNQGQAFYDPNDPSVIFVVQPEEFKVCSAADFRSGSLLQPIRISQ